MCPLFGVTSVSHLTHYFISGKGGVMGNTPVLCGTVFPFAYLFLAVLVYINRSEQSAFN